MQTIISDTILRQPNILLAIAVCIMNLAPLGSKDHNISITTIVKESTRSIEHRLSSEISKNWAGEPLDSYQKILRFIRSTRTQTGLAVTAYLDRRHYQTGIEPTREQLQGLRLQLGEVLPKWNYMISPVL